jgi:hypothetical protein
MYQTEVRVVKYAAVRLRKINIIRGRYASEERSVTEVFSEQDLVYAGLEARQARRSGSIGRRIKISISFHLRSTFLNETFVSTTSDINTTCNITSHTQQ